MVKYPSGSLVRFRSDVELLPPSVPEPMKGGVTSPAGGGHGRLHREGDTGRRHRRIQLGGQKQPGGAARERDLRRLRWDVWGGPHAPD